MAAFTPIERKLVRLPPEVPRGGSKLGFSRSAYPLRATSNARLVFAAFLVDSHRQARQRHLRGDRERSLRSTSLKTGSKDHQDLQEAGSRGYQPGPFSSNSTQDQLSLLQRVAQVRRVQGFRHSLRLVQGQAQHRLRERQQAHQHVLGLRRSGPADAVV